jgi:uncharacterized protein YlxP (DUF503 family)
MMDWGAKYNAQCPRREIGQRLKTEKAAVIKEYLDKLKKQFPIATSESDSQD